jgi:hypothetical protein
VYLSFDPGDADITPGTNAVHPIDTRGVTIGHGDLAGLKAFFYPIQRALLGKLQSLVASTAIDILDQGGPLL